MCSVCLFRLQFNATTRHMRKTSNIFVQQAIFQHEQYKDGGQRRLGEVTWAWTFLRYVLSSVFMPGS